MLSIQLLQLQFFAYHGLYEEEQLNGNNFEVNIDIETTIAERVESIDHTINYATVYEIIRKRMSEPTALLETLAQDMIDLVFAFDGRIKCIDLSIKKLKPPIENFKGMVGVRLKKVL